MINLAVINIKDVLKILRKSIILIILLFILIYIIKNNKFDVKYLKEEIISNSAKLVDKNILLSSYYHNNENKSKLKKVLTSELAIFYAEEELMEKENQEEVLEFDNNTNDNENINANNDDTNGNSNDSNNSNNSDNNLIENNLNEIPTFINTKVIEQNNKIDNYTNVYNSVKIKNESSYNLTEEMIIPNVELKDKKDVIIYHTHTCESYTPTESSNYVASGNFRTIDLNYNVTRVGTELTNNLTSLGFNVIHNTNYHDYPEYTGSYSRSLETINSILAQNPNSEFVIDLHRDAIGSMSNYAPCVQIGDEKAAQLMFVIGTDGGGLEHKDWLYNFKLAIKIQEIGNNMYPGLFKPIILRNSRYNQHVTKGACIIEVGATGNTLEECNTSMKYLAKVIKEAMK